MSTLSLLETTGSLTESLMAQTNAGAVNLDFDMTVVAQMVFLAILVIILKPLLFEPMLKLFEERERRSDGARLAARKLDERAGELLKGYEAELDKVRRSANAEREMVRAEAQVVEAKIVGDARAETAAFLERGKRAMLQEVQALRSELFGQTAELGQQLASRVIDREVG